MDNKENRKFYWEIKDFVQNNDKVAPKAPSPSNILKSVKNILEQNKPYTKNTFNPNINSNNGLSQVLTCMEKFKKEGDPNCVGYSKNVYRNGFGLIREQEEDYFSNVLRQVQQNQNAEDINPMATADELARMIDQDQIEPGAPLSQRQRTLRDMEARARAKENLAKATSTQAQQASGVSPEEYAEIQKQTDSEAWKNADRAAVERGDMSPKQYNVQHGEAPQASDSNAPGGVQGRTLKQPQAQPATPGVDVEGPPVPTAEEERAAAAQAQKDAEQSADKKSADKKSEEPAQDDELEKRVSGRISRRDREAAKAKQDAAIQLAGMRERGPVNNTPAARAMHAQALARLELRAKGEDLSVRKGLTDQQIRDQEKRALAQKRSQGTAVQGSQTALPGKDITRQTPEQAADINNPAKGGQSGIFGAPRQGQQTTGTTPSTTGIGQGTAPGSTPNRSVPPTNTPSQTQTTGTAPGSTPNRSVPPTNTPSQTQTTGTKPTSSSSTVPVNTSSTSSSSGSLSTGSAVNTTARETLGLGKAPAPTQPTTPGVNAARETLGMGKPQEPTPEESQTKKNARQTLMR